MIGGREHRSRVADRPLRTAPTRVASVLLVGFVVGPILWVVALISVAWVLHFTSAIELGLLIVLISAVVSTILLVLLHQSRVREEKRYAARG